MAGLSSMYTHANHCILSFKGNRHINAIASQGDYELRVDLEDFEGNTRYAKYSVFQLGDSTVNYQLTVAGYSGTAGKITIAMRQEKVHLQGK